MLIGVNNQSSFGGIVLGEVLQSFAIGYQCFAQLRWYFLLFVQAIAAIYGILGDFALPRCMHWTLSLSKAISAYHLAPTSNTIWIASMAWSVVRVWISFFIGRNSAFSWNLVCGFPFHFTVFTGYMKSRWSHCLELMTSLLTLTNLVAVDCNTIRVFNLWFYLES